MPMFDSEKEMRLSRIQEGLNCSREEAEEVLEYDIQVEKTSSGLEYDLTKEQNKVAQSFAKTGTRKTPVIVDPKPRARKENPTKASLIEELFKFLTENSENACENVEITNKEQKIFFSIGENNYEITLTQKRKPKN